MVKKLCPVCGEPLHTIFDTLEGVVLEDWEECKNCGYLYGYAYGGYEVKVKGQFWNWNYNTNWETVQKIQNEIEEKLKGFNIKGDS